MKMNYLKYENEINEYKHKNDILILQHKNVEVLEYKLQLL